MCAVFFHREITNGKTHKLKTTKAEPAEQKLQHSAHRDWYLGHPFSNLACFCVCVVCVLFMCFHGRVVLCVCRCRAVSVRGALVHVYDTGRHRGRKNNTALQISPFISRHDGTPRRPLNHTSWKREVQSPPPSKNCNIAMLTNRGTEQLEGLDMAEPLATHTSHASSHTPHPAPTTTFHQTVRSNRTRPTSRPNRHSSHPNDATSKPECPTDQKPTSNEHRPDQTNRQQLTASISISTGLPLGGRASMAWTHRALLPCAGRLEQRSLWPWRATLNGRFSRRRPNLWPCRTTVSGTISRRRPRGNLCLL